MLRPAVGVARPAQWPINSSWTRSGGALSIDDALALATQLAVRTDYTDTIPRPFAEVCADPASPVLRDRDLTQDGNPDHVNGPC